MVRAQDFEELAQVIAWGNTADSFAASLARLEAGIPVERELLESQADSAARVIQCLLASSKTDNSLAFDSGSVYSASAVSYWVEVSGEGALPDLREVIPQLDRLSPEDPSLLSHLRVVFSDLGRAMQLAAAEISEREAMSVL